MVRQYRLKITLLVGGLIPLKVVAQVCSTRSLVTIVGHDMHSIHFGQQPVIERSSVILHELLFWMMAKAKAYCAAANLDEGGECVA